MKFYVAGRFQAYAKVRAMVDFLTEHGHSVTYDWTRTDEFDRYGNPVQGDPHNLQRDKLREYAQKDLQGVMDAEFFVLCGDDSLAGAWVELGVALVSPNVERIFALEPERWTIFLEDPKVVTLNYEQFREMVLEGL